MSLKVGQSPMVQCFFADVVSLLLLSFEVSGVCWCYSCWCWLASALYGETHTHIHREKLNPFTLRVAQKGARYNPL